MTNVKDDALELALEALEGSLTAVLDIAATTQEHLQHDSSQAARLVEYWAAVDTHRDAIDAVRAALELNPMDYRQLLVKYMRMILALEGTLFIPRLTGNYWFEFTQEQIQELEAIGKEVRDAL